MHVHCMSRGFVLVAFNFVPQSRRQYKKYREAPAQQLQEFRSNEEILAHPCGSYVLDRLQCGVSPEAVLQVLRREYLVETSRLRLLAYRRFCERTLSPCWTVEDLELRFWEYLYEQVPAYAPSLRSDDRNPKVACIRSLFCEHADVSEELLPARVFRTFYKKHGQQAALPEQYPDAVLVKDSLSIEVVEAYAAPLRGRTLPGLASRCITQYGSAVGRQVFLLVLSFVYTKECLIFVFYSYSEFL